MKNIQLITILIIALLFPISGNAGDKDVYVINTPLDVNVSNTPMVEVINTEPMPTVVSNTSSNPIPVTMNENTGSEIVSAYAVISGTPQTLYTVPPNKTFILTDIFSSLHDTLDIFENAVLKTRVQFTPENLSLHLRSGIPFSSSSSVVIDNNTTNRGVTITGYLLEN